jgi:hypothetical protein
MTEQAIGIVRASDVLILSTPQGVKADAKQQYLDWFRGTLIGTSLEHCKVILLDGGAEIQVFRGEPVT